MPVTDTLTLVWVHVDAVSHQRTSGLGSRGRCVPPEDFWSGFTWTLCPTRGLLVWVHVDAVSHQRTAGLNLKQADIDA
ncbi:hypothetical protein NHX12_012994 [Muraenolepis orangiensis]|uniref:Uncharacterized protein n=1 Tax=Muraenolepis orangiensis TaxID=630683 RepID=A0A9Q0DDR8_9TELE|nr:hypothetical protein NHX12_012994 [Muraenolepis orangiensis]